MTATRLALRQINCEHGRFSGSVQIGAIIDKEPAEYIVDVTVHCEDCKMPFKFDVELPKKTKGVALSGDKYQLRAKLSAE